MSLHEAAASEGLQRQPRATPVSTAKNNLAVVHNSMQEVEGAPVGRESKNTGLDDLTEETRRAFEPTSPAVDPVSTLSAAALVEHLFGLLSPAKGRLVASTYTMTPDFRAGIKAIASAAGMSSTELVRRAVFTIALNPKLLRDQRVNEMERQYVKGLGVAGRPPMRDAD